MGKRSVSDSGILSEGKESVESGFCVVAVSGHAHGRGQGAWEH